MSEPKSQFPEVKFLELRGRRLAFRHSPGRAPYVVFLHGYASDMEGEKAKTLEGLCRREELGFVRFDCSGHGMSSQKITDGTLGQWLEDCLAVIKHTAAARKFIAVGSSMGGWLMLLIALRMPRAVCGLLGIAAAPDFSETLIWRGLGAARKSGLEKSGFIRIESPYGDYPITMRFILEARRHLLGSGTLPITVPVRLLHGMKDNDVPWQVSGELASRLEGENVAVTLVKDASHRFSRPRDLALLEETASALIAEAKALKPCR